jgi:hypothetical protein
MSTEVPEPDRRIKFLSRDLPFPTNPTYREYRVINELTGVTAEQIMTGTAGVWMLPALAILALYRADRNVARVKLEKILDLAPSDISLEGFPDSILDEDDDENPPVEAAVETVEVKTKRKSTGIESTPEILETSGTPDLPTTSQEQPVSPTT